MRGLLVTLLVVCLAGCASRGLSGLERALVQDPTDVLVRAVVGPQDDGTYVVPTTQIVNPAGESIVFPGRPMDLALSPDESLLAVKSHGDIVLIDLETRAIRQRLVPDPAENSFHGIQWSSDGRRLWVTNSRGFLLEAVLNETGQLDWGRRILLVGPGGTGSSVPGGFFIDEPSSLAYVALSRNNTVGVVDLAAEKVVEEIPVGIAPYSVLRVGDEAYATNWGGRRPQPGDLTGLTSGSEAVIDPAGIASTGTVSVIDLAARRVSVEIPVGLHPCGMALGPDSSRLYVANANSDTVAVIDTASDTVVADWIAKPMKELPFGSAPNGLALSPDGATLYVALGGNNCIAVMSTDTGAVRGLIPTGWYPGAVALSQDGGTLHIANVKGVGSRLVDDAQGRINLAERLAKESVPNPGNSHDHLGSVTRIGLPDAATLEDYTYQAAVAMRLPRMNEVVKMPQAAPRVVPVPTRPGEQSVFKHVLYIIKENRTYDQVFGDLPQGNGEPKLLHFGRDVTPNHHALAEEFVLLDNFYCNGVLSADGHQWTDEGYVTDYIEKSFGGYPRSYPYEGDDVVAFASSGFIWDHVLAAGLTFRNYGEMIRAQIEPATATWTEIWRDFQSGEGRITIRATTPVEGLKPYICPGFIGFPNTVSDQQRASVFLEEFREAEKSGEWHNFVIMLLPNDHTSGTVPGYPTPRAAVADNDLALGRIVDAVSRSRFWKETLILVVEDDPQAGLDHVDGHRTVALCISPYTKRGEVVSTHLNQTSMLRTMELVFGLNPMNQMTMAANPMTDCFMETADFSPYDVRPNQVPLDELNPEVSALRGKQRYWAEKSLELPLDDIDQADEDTLNRILWHSVKGYNTPYPRLAKAAPGE